MFLHYYDKQSTTKTTKTKIYTQNFKTFRKISLLLLVSQDEDNDDKSKHTKWERIKLDDVDIHIKIFR